MSSCLELFASRHNSFYYRHNTITSPADPAFLFHAVTVTVAVTLPMAEKTVEEQLAELEMMGAEEPAAPPPKTAKASKAPRPSSKKDLDALKQLEELEALEKFQRPEAPKPSSRPNTPKLSSASTTSSNPRRAGVVTPSSSGSARTSEDNAQAPRKSGESARSFHQSFAPTQEEPAKPASEPKQAGGSWWGGLLSTATATADAARKRAEAAYAEIQKNKEAQRWAEQVRGNLDVEALRGISTPATSTMPGLN